MNGLVNYLTDNGFKYGDDVDMSTIYFSKIYNDKEWLFSLTEPHEGNRNQWLFRAEKRDNFDRWSNAYYEEKYMSTDHFMSCAIKELESTIQNYSEDE
jgi:hypothetical protein